MQVLCNANQSASLSFQKLHETKTMADGNDSNRSKIDSLTDSLCTHKELIFFKFRFINKQYQEISKDTGRYQKINNRKK